MADTLDASSLCFCSERKSVHVHCPCEECRGKPVHYMTQERHLSALRLLQQENGSSRSSLLPKTSCSAPDNHQDGSVQQQENECSNSTSGCDSFEDNGCVFTGNYTEFVSHSSINFRRNVEVTENEGIEDHCYGALEDNKIKDAVVCAIFESLDLLHETKGNMVSVKGDQDEIWHAEVRQVDHEQKKVKGYFFVKHSRWEHNHLWVRESNSRVMESISFKSIMDVLPGTWVGPNWQEQT